MWQKCPVCNGNGNKPSTFNQSGMVDCKTCKGSGIINSLTGLPPSKNTDDFEEKFK